MNVLFHRLFALVLSLNAGLAMAENATNKLVLGFAEFPPYSIEQGAATDALSGGPCESSLMKGHGIDVDFLELVLKEAGISYQTKFFPQARLALLLEHKRVDITASLFYSEDSAQNGKIRYIKYDSGGATTFYANDTIAPSITAFSDIKKHVLGAVRMERFHHDELNDWVTLGDESKVIIANNYDHLFLMLAKQRVDLIATNDTLGAYMSQNLSLRGVSLAPYRVPYGSDPQRDGIYIGVRSGFPDEQFIKIKRATEKLVADNVLECIKVRYGIHRY